MIISYKGKTNVKVVWCTIKIYKFHQKFDPSQNNHLSIKILISFLNSGENEYLCINCKFQFCITFKFRSILTDIVTTLMMFVL